MSITEFLHAGFVPVRCLAQTVEGLQVFLCSKEQRRNEEKNGFNKIIFKRTS